MSFYTCMIVMLGGALGTLARYLMTLATMPVSRYLPWGTILGVNVLGSLAIGFFATLTLAHGRFPVSENTRLFVMVGLCGGYTTFSSFSLQTFDLMRGDAWFRALANVALSVALCMAAVSFGHIVASRLNGDTMTIVQNKTEEGAS